MAVVRLPQPYANNQASMLNMEALQTLGEECIVLIMYHEIIDTNTRQRCPNYDADYNQDSHYNCESCLGTTFLGGVRKIGRAWSLFGDAQGKEGSGVDGEGSLPGTRGLWIPDRRFVQIESIPYLTEHDCIIRVKQWSDTHVPLVLGERYMIDVVDTRSVRTGNRYGQWHQRDFMGSKSIVREVYPADHPLYKVQISLTEPMPRLDAPLSYGIEMLDYDSTDNNQ